MKHSVCRDLELRVNNKSDVHKSTVEVCIDDQWHELHEAISANLKVANINSQSLQDISVMIVDSTSESVMLEWSGQQSIPSDKNISGYDLSCIALSLSDHGQIHEVRVPNISTSTTRVQVSELLPDTAYQCCVNAHIQTNTPLDLISSNCVSTRTVNITVTDSVTKFVSTETVAKISTVSTEEELMSTRCEFVSNYHGCSDTGLGIGLGVAYLLLVASIVINIIFLTMCLKNNATKSIFKPCTNK